MLRRFKEGSIRLQIVTLAVFPIVLVGVLGIITEPLFPQDSTLTRAEVVAAQIALVADQVENSGTSELAETTLEATRRSGLDVQWISSFAEEAMSISTFEERVLYALSTIHHRDAFLLADNGPEPLIALNLAGRFLAFAPEVEFVPGWLNDDIVNIMLTVVIIVLPVVLLSIYAASLLTGPLTRIAAAAREHDGMTFEGGHLEDSGPREIRQLARRLNEMSLHIRGMLDQRTAMLRAVSHDLRTPLTRLKLRIERSVPADTAEMLIRDIASINVMITETLNYLRTDTETETMRKADLPSLLRTVCSDFSDVGFAVGYSGPDRLVCRCRPKALTRAISNLIDNGTKFGETVTVTLSTTPDGMVEVVVADDGQGIPDELREKVLLPFVKADSARTSAARNGFGLGLAIAHEVALGHGGTLSLRPRSPNGLEATITLPGG